MTTATAAVAIFVTLAASSGDQLPGEQFTELLGLRLLGASLADVQKRLGSVEIKKTGDAGEYLATLCYTDPQVQTAILFKSGEMGGPDQRLLGFELRPYAGQTDSGCRRLEPATAARHKLRVGRLQLGMTRQAYARAVGELQELPGRGVGHVFTRRQPMTPEELARCPGCAPYPFWDVVIEVAGEFRNGVLVRFAAWKTVTS